MSIEVQVMGFHVECEQSENGETRIVSVCRARGGAVEPATLTQMALCENVSLVMVRRRIEVAVLAAVLRGAVDARGDTLWEGLPSALFLQNTGQFSRVAPLWAFAVVCALTLSDAPKRRKRTLKRLYEMRLPERAALALTYDLGGVDAVRATLYA